MVNLKSIRFHWLAVVTFLVCATGVSAQAISVSEALSEAEKLQHNETSAQTYTIEGYVNYISENSFNTNYNNMTFWIADSRGHVSSTLAGGLQVFRGRPDVELHEGDKVQVVAKLKRYYETIETTPQNAPVTLLEAASALDTIKGSLRVCAQNLENYYYNLNTGRGNYTEAERAEKTRKIVNMILNVDADIYAFCELEAKPIILLQLVDSVNARINGTPFAAVTDNIDVEWSESADYNLKSGFIYRSDRVAPVGSSTGGTSGNGYYAHTMRIQTFKQLSNNEKLVVSMNHFKAKDSSSDQGETQRNTNATNLVNSLSKVTADQDILVLGDMNCEFGEAPLDIIVNAGFSEQLLRFDSTAYSHCYGGGELIDHVFANSSMKEQIVCAYVKHVSAYKCNPSLSKNDYYSDHDPYVVEINLEGNSSDPCENLGGDYLATGGSDLGEMTQVSLSGQYYWQYKSQYGASCQDPGGEDWLLTPAYDYSQAKSVKLEFDHTIGYANISDMSTEQTLWVTPDFSSVAESEWHQLTIPTYPAGNNWTFVHAEVNVPKQYFGSNTVFGFKYKVAQGASNKPNWEIKNLKVIGSCEGTTAIDQTEQDESQAIRFIRNGQLFIQLPDGSQYTIMGVKVN